MFSDKFSEGKLKDLRDSFPLDHPTELDDHDLLDDSDLEDVEDDEGLITKTPKAASENRRSPLRNPMFGSGFTSPFLQQTSQLGSVGGMSSIRPAQSVDPGTHLGKVVVLRDTSFVT